MVAKVVRLDGKLMIELDAEAERALGAVHGGVVQVIAEPGRLVLESKDELDRAVDEIVRVHGRTLERLAK